MKKITLSILVLFFYTLQSSQETQQSSPESGQSPSTSQQQAPPSSTQQGTPSIAMRTEQLEAFLSLLPDPNLPQFSLLPQLNGAITLIYEETLQVPPIIFNGIKRFYAFLQARALEDNKIVLTNLSQQDQESLNNNIIQLCTNSSLWQNYKKIFITESLEYGTSLLKSVHQQEKVIFSHIPHFETAYYTEGYTDIRNGAELVRLSMVLSDAMRNRAIAQSSWSNITNFDQLYAEIENYQESEIYSINKILFSLIKDSTHYPFPSNVSLVDHNGTITPAFNHFVFQDKNGTLEVAEYAQLIMNIDQNNQPYLTALGNYIFSHDTSVSGPYLAKNPVFNVLFQETTNGPLPQPIFLEILAFEAIKLINFNLGYYFNSTNLEPTMQALTALEQKYPGILQQVPIILPYVPQDYPYLARIQELIPLVNPSSSAPQASVQGWFSHMVNSISSAARSVGQAFKTAGDAIASAARTTGEEIASAGKKLGKDLGYAFRDAGEGVGFWFAAGALLLVSPFSPKLGRLSTEFYKRSSNNFSNMGSDVAGAIQQVGNIITDSTTLVTTTLAQIMGAFIGDNQLGTDLAGLSTVLISTLVNAGIDVTDVAIEGTIDAYRLTAEAVQVATAACLAAITVGQDTTVNKEFLSEGNYFAKDIVISILTELTFALDAVGTLLTGVMESIAYLCCCMIDLIGDVFGDLAAIGADIGGANGSDVWLKVKNGVHTWRRTIIGSIMLVGGAVLMASGVGAPEGLELAATATMMLAGTGMMAIGTMGDVQADILAKKKMEYENALLASYSAAVPQEEIATQTITSLAIAEATAQLAAEKDNLKRSEIYYQNFFNNKLNSNISQYGFSVGSFYQQNSLPLASIGLPPSDPGVYYGIKTGRMALNPAGGFYTFNYARNTFAQEIAIAPQQTHGTSQNTLFTLNPSPTDLWINQKDLSNVWQDNGFEVEVRWRTIYETEGNFYIGVFVSEKVMNIPLLQALNKNYLDAQKLNGDDASWYIEQTWGNLDTFNRNLLNYNNLSRNFVIFREDGAVPQLGLYQHQGAGNGWLNRNIGGVTYQRGIWYRMKVAINGETTQVKCWEEAGYEPSEWTTFTTPQATRAPIIKPIQLPNDTDPFEIIVTPPTPPTPPANKQPTQTTNTQSTSNTNTQPSEPSQSQHSGWSLTPAQQAPELTGPGWVINKPNNNLQQVQGPSWSVNTPAQAPEPTGPGWVLSGALQQEESDQINTAIGSMGIIASGAAVEYQILSPATPLKIMPVRASENASIESNFQESGVTVNEQERERQWLIQNGIVTQEVSQPPTQSPTTMQPTSQPATPKTDPQNTTSTPKHSIFWYLMNDPAALKKKNINSKISTAGKFSALGGPK